MRYPGHPCPRCGQNVMRPRLVENSLSRGDNLTHICPACGRAEAMLRFEGVTLDEDRQTWAMDNPDPAIYMEPF